MPGQVPAPQPQAQIPAATSQPRPGGTGERGNSFSNGYYGPPENVSRGLYGEAKGQWEGVA